ncbi:twin transmembrane helix small protein [Stappia sp.]|uniref:twin transmembrane helix small protein n=1 Tax=Stappia sp. TaxID=1870903 RepID=UPI003C7B472C
MTDVLRMLIPVAVGAVAVVLMMGLWNMMRGGSSSRSQTLMRWRVGLQFLAVVIVMTLLYLTTSTP